jgi:hypothetical protein
MLFAFVFPVIFMLEGAFLSDQPAQAVSSATKAFTVL